MVYRKINNDLKNVASHLKACCGDTNYEIAQIIMPTNASCSLGVLLLHRPLVVDAPSHSSGLRQDWDYLLCLTWHKPTLVLDEYAQQLQQNWELSVCIPTIHRSLECAGMNVKHVQKMTTERDPALRADVDFIPNWPVYVTYVTQLHSNHFSHSFFHFISYFFLCSSTLPKFNFTTCIYTKILPDVSYLPFGYVISTHQVTGVYDMPTAVSPLKLIILSITPFGHLRLSASHTYGHRLCWSLLKLRCCNWSFWLKVRHGHHRQAWRQNHLFDHLSSTVFRNFNKGSYFNYAL